MQWLVAPIMELMKMFWVRRVIEDNTLFLKKNGMQKLITFLELGGLITHICLKVHLIPPQINLSLTQELNQLILALRNCFALVWNKNRHPLL